jgi:hypothetical protein
LKISVNSDHVIVHYYVLVRDIKFLEIWIIEMIIYAIFSHFYSFGMKFYVKIIILKNINQNTSPS